MKNTFIVILLINLISCGVQDNDSGVNFTNYRNTVKSTAGNSAKDCGLVEISLNQLSTNICVVDSFVNKTPFFAIYKTQGIDSSTASGIAQGKNKILYFLYFDSDPSGGGKPNNGKITKNMCKKAKFLGNVDVDYSELFSCAA